jgi:hypothetical protein
MTIPTQWSKAALTTSTPIIPPVVEVYYDKPQNIPPYSPSSLKDYEDEAKNLGNPITITARNIPISKLNGINKDKTQSQSTRLITQERGEEPLEFNFEAQSENPTENPETTEFEFTIPTENPQPDSISIPIPQPINVVEVISDRQEFDDQQQVITAEGNVVMRFAQAVLSADRLQVNLNNRIAVAEGNVALRRGEQVLRGSRFEYYFMEDSGLILNASGEVYQPLAGRDFNTSMIIDADNNNIPDQPLSDNLASRQPLQRISTAEGIQFVLGSVGSFNRLEQSGAALPNPQAGGQINRIRFEADQVNFTSRGWTATNIRLTNDPFSPPELEIRADTADFTNLSPFVDELVTTNSRMVFDRKVSIPLFRNRFVFDRRPRQPGLFQVKFDGEERGGLYIEREFDLINTSRVTFSLTPQYYVQRAWLPDSLAFGDENEEEVGPFDPGAVGVTARLSGNFSDRTGFRGRTTLTSLEEDELTENLEANIRLSHLVGNINNPYAFSLEYNYRDRLFNGSLGFQRVRSSFGFLVTSPRIELWDSDIFLTYQGSIQNINANTDRRDLLEPVRDDNRIRLTRFQGAASLSRFFSLWQGEALPATAEEGLRYTSTPVVPYIGLSTGVTGVQSIYSNGDTQPSVSVNVGLLGQFGHFSDPFFDYTGFRIAYTQAFRGDASPFLFDRIVDRQTVSLGLTQQIYGPVRGGVQASFSLNQDDSISTDFFLEYSRRTHNFVIRYNPVLEIGSINLRINDFNWLGSPEPFNGTGIRSVQQGVTQ